MKYFSKVLILLVLLALLLSACQPAVATEPAAEEPAAEEPKPAEPKEVVKAALVLPGVISDAGWNAAAYDGLMAAKDELGAEVAYSESVQLADFEATFRDYASQGYDIVIGHGSEFGDAALAVAKEFPDTFFAVTNSNVKSANVAGLDTKNEETGYMAGFIAGTITKSKVVGYIGAMEIVAMVRGQQGYELGVEAACPDCEVLVSYVGSFDDIAKGKETALAQIDKGADVLFAYADAAGLGSLEAAQDKGLFAIGSGYDQKELAPKAVVVSCLQKLAPMIVSIVREVQDGTFTPNQVRMYGYDTGAYDLGELDMTMVTQEQADAILKVRDQLKAGEIELPHLSDVKEAAEEEEKPMIKAALVLPGVISDAGWNAAAYDGLMAAKDELGAEVAYSESVQLADFEATFRDYASQGYDIVIGHGSEFGDAALAVAKEFPDTFFAVTNSNVKSENVAGLDTKNEETGYMAGFIAGTITKSKVVGYIGAMEIVAMVRGQQGYELGVEAACPDCEVLVSYVGSFDDIAKGKETALAQIDKGADVLFAYADAAGLGSLEAAQDKGLFAIGSGYDQKELAPKAVVVSCLQKLAPMIVSIVREVQDGSFTPNQVRMYGYDTGAYDLGELDMTMVTQEQADAILKVRDQLKAGEIELPHLSD